MARKNSNARKVYRINYARFSREIGLTVKQRVKTIRYFEKILREVERQ